MRLIPSRYHAPLDYIVVIVLIAAPWIFQFSDIDAATAVSIVLGVGLIVYSLVTNYALGVWKGGADGRPQSDRHRGRRAARGVAVALRLRGRRDPRAGSVRPHRLAAVFLGFTTSRRAAIATASPASAAGRPSAAEPGRKLTRGAAGRRPDEAVSCSARC